MQRVGLRLSLAVCVLVLRVLYVCVGASAAAALREFERGFVRNQALARRLRLLATPLHHVRACARWQLHVHGMQHMCERCTQNTAATRAKESTLEFVVCAPASWQQHGVCAQSSEQVVCVGVCRESLGGVGRARARFGAECSEKAAVFASLSGARRSWDTMGHRKRDDVSERKHCEKKGGADQSRRVT